MVFRARQPKTVEQFLYDGQPLEVVHSFVYLGVEMSSNSSWQIARARCVSQARKALFLMEKRLYRWFFTVREVIETFERLVLPVLLYGAELWGCGPVDDIAQFVLGFLKKLLGLKPSTASYFVWIESGMIPIVSKCVQRALGFWVSLVDIHARPRLAGSVLKLLLSEQYLNWTTYVGHVMHGIGLGSAWNSQCVVNKLSFMEKLRTECDLYYALQEYSKCCASPKGGVYMEICPYITYKQGASYLNILNKEHRTIICRFRCRNVFFKYETGSWLGIPRDLRLCSTCGVLDDDMHYVLSCGRFSVARRKYINPSYWESPSLYHLVRLLCVSDKPELHKLAKYLLLAEKLSKEVYLVERQISPLDAITNSLG